MASLSTLLALTVFTPAVAGCLLLLSWLQNRRIVALALWGSGFITTSVATALIVLARDRIPDFWSIVVGNALLAAAYGILWCGARKFERKRISILLMMAARSATYRPLRKEWRPANNYHSCVRRAAMKCKVTYSALLCRLPKSKRCLPSAACAWWPEAISMRVCSAIRLVVVYAKLGSEIDQAGDGAAGVRLSRGWRCSERRSTQTRASGHRCEMEYLCLLSNLSEFCHPICKPSMVRRVVRM